MANAVQARRGRPPLGEEVKRASFNTRLRESLKKRLEEDAANGGYSLSEEIERRLEASYERIESRFGGRAGLNLALLLFANFKHAGEQQADRLGHPDWTTSEWLRDESCFERGLAGLVQAVWGQHPGGVTLSHFGSWLQNLYNRAHSRELNIQEGAAAAETATTEKE